MYPLHKILLATVLLITYSITTSHAAVFIKTTATSGTITQGGITVGTWSFDSDDTVGFGGITSTVGNNGVEFAYANDNSNADVLAANITITAAAGYDLSSITISQSIYSNAGGNNGHPSGTPNLSILGYTDSFTQVLSGQTTTADNSSGDLEWNYITTNAEDRINNDVDAWSVTLTEVNSGQEYQYRSESTLNHFVEWVSFDATFIKIPEPSALFFLALSSICFVIRRDATQYK